MTRLLNILMEQQDTLWKVTEADTGKVSYWPSKFTRDQVEYAIWYARESVARDRYETKMREIKTLKEETVRIINQMDPPRSPRLGEILSVLGQNP